MKLIVIASIILSTEAFANNDETKITSKNGVSANIFAQSNDMVILQLTNPAESKTRIAILDEKCEILYKEIVEKDITVLKRYDVSNLPSGIYSYKVSNQSYLFEKRIEKK